ncbi:segregation/condensation protein A [Methanocaldococcus indicus]|uniref:segregation/condensation protein A n=1 Tax=Methanocaldococcus indicus TaxID=213231 RepID=UPI003C6D85D2
MDIELWVRIIKEGIKSKKLNPWDVNIAEIADYYINKIKELKNFDIKLSADVVLVGGILLRLKSESLYNEVNPKEEKKRKKREKKEKITTDELINKVDKELKKIKREYKKKSQKDKEIYVDDLDDLVNELIDDEEDIDKIVEELYLLILKEEYIIFQEKFKNREEKVKYLLPSLYLANENKIDIIQEKFFDNLILKRK